MYIKLIDNEREVCMADAEVTSLLAIEKLQREMKGEAKKAGITCEADVVELCKEVRRELYLERYACND
jgi:hypothetical protein